MASTRSPRERKRPWPPRSPPISPLSSPVRSSTPRPKSTREESRGRPWHASSVSGIDASTLNSAIDTIIAKTLAEHPEYGDFPDGAAVDVAGEQNSLVEQPDFGDLSDDLEIDVAGHQVQSRSNEQIISKSSITPSGPPKSPKLGCAIRPLEYETLTDVVKGLLSASNEAFANCHLNDYQSFLDYVNKTHQKLQKMVEHARNILESEAIILMLGGVIGNLKGMSPFVQSKAQKDSFLHLGNNIGDICNEIKEKADKKKIRNDQIAERMLKKLKTEITKMRTEIDTTNATSEELRTQNAKLTEAMAMQKIQLKSAKDELVKSYNIKIEGLKSDLEKVKAESEQRGKLIKELEEALSVRDKEIERSKIKDKETKRNLKNLDKSLTLLKAAYEETEGEDKSGNP